MDEHDWLAERFESHRTHLRAVAYRMLGSANDADDAVQESWLRVSRTGSSEVENFGGWLTTIVARVCLNMLSSRESRREEPLAADAADGIKAVDGADPEEQAVLADSVGPALLVVLDSLTPAERLAFVLHDMFAVPFEEIAPMVGRSPAATRQLASRARRRVQGSAPAPGDPALQRRVVGAFLAASRGGDSTRCSRCWTLRWCCDPTPPPSPRGRRRRSGGRATSRTRSPGGRGPRDRPSSTGPPGWCGPRAGSPGWCSGSPSRAGGSPRSTWWPTPTPWATSTWNSSMCAFGRPVLPRTHRRRTDER